MPLGSIMPEGPDQVLAPMPVPKPAPRMREFGDSGALRNMIYERTLEAARGIQPLVDERHTLKLSGVDWADPERFTRKRRKEAVLTGETLARRMKGTWELSDNATGELLEKRDQIIARVPYLSSLGTFTQRGSEYTVNHQPRLEPGIFTRIKANGEIESHANVKVGKGVSHHYFLNPATEQFKIKLGQAEMPLMPLLQAMGATDKELRANWGDSIYASNYRTNDASTLKKLAQKLLRKQDLEGDEGSVREKLLKRFTTMEIDPEVSRRTLGKPYQFTDKDALLATTRRLLAVNRKHAAPGDPASFAEPDDRDHLSYQRFYGPEDLFAERITKDHGRHRAMLFKKISMARSLAKMPSGALTPQLEQLLMGSGLGQAIEEINPLEILDKQSRITRMGEGGISSLDSVPYSSRNVTPSHTGYIDLLRTPESFRAGIDLNMARGSRKGDDGRIYAQLTDHKTGQLVWKAPQELNDSVISFPGNKELEWTKPAPGFDANYAAAMKRREAGLRATPQDDAAIRAYEQFKSRPTGRVFALRGGKPAYVKPGEVDYVLPNFEDTFSPLGNLVPLKSMVKGQRVSMASRMLTQALPLIKPEAPLVQSGLPGSKGSRSFEEEYAKHMGAVAADKDGRVIDIRDGSIQLQYADGTKDSVELYNTHPLNRKTFLHQTAMMQPGQSFKKGELLAKSNFTDDKGVMAVGLNLYAGYMPYEGYNFEDAGVISESAAKKLTSEHAYHHQLDVTEKHKLGKNSFVNLFPATFDRKTLDGLDDDGRVRPGQVVHYGDPLILAARERDKTQNKIHKAKQAGFHDESVLWKHHDPGVVTDVVNGRNGPVVLVKSTSQMQVGDKLSGRYGDKSVLAAILPDHEMPHDSQGKPYEILLNPAGIPTRTNPAQIVEAALGKIARKTGQAVKVPDFEDVEDMSAWAAEQLRKHGLVGEDTVTFPKTNTKVGGIYTGHRFFMKLHHTAEGKSQGRSSGSYSSDETPAKGGETGCFTGDTLVDVVGPCGNGPHGVGTIDIKCLVENRLKVEAITRYPMDHRIMARTISDWFRYEVLPSELVTITLANGVSFSVTKNHEFILLDGSRCRAGDLKRAFELMTTGVRSWMS